MSELLTRYPQNLLPLVLRPLRLFIAPNSLRACRIALLKVTHWPLVALILAYENGRRAVDRRRDGEPSTAAAPRSSLMRRPLSSRSVPTRLKIRISDSPPSGQSNAGQLSRNGHTSRTASSLNRIETLESLAASLRLQLETVESMIESEKTQSSSLDA